MIDVMMFRTAVLWMSLLGVTGCASKQVAVIDYSTPERAFETWRQAVARLDTKAIVDSYARDAQGVIRKEIADTSQDGLRAMQEETQRTKFKIEKIVYQENRAFLRVRRDLDSASDVEVVTMVQEEGHWRLIP